MYVQEEYIYSEFIKNYPDKSEPIAIYGIGVDAGLLVPKISDYNLVGLMDKDKKSGMIYDKPIIDYSDILDKKVKKIVIIARPAVLGVIYRRIQKFSLENNIFVGDVRGRDLSKIYQSREVEHPFFEKCISDLESAVSEYDVVSFDIFDTLLVRKTLKPENIFEIMSFEIKKRGYSVDDFLRMRMLAEDNCYKKGINPTLHQIYDEFSKITGCDDEYNREFYRLEIEIEKKFIRPRNKMLDFFNRIKDYKEIYLISDMYLTSDVIAELLGECGYSGYIKIFVSCEHGCSKTEGLFDVFEAEVLKGRKSIHIGDNEISDGKAALSAGLNSFIIMSEREMLENSSFGEATERCSNLIDKISLGLFCNEAFDDPFVLFGTKGKVQLNSHRVISYLFLAPEILYFCCWLIRGVLEKKCEFVMYPSRDAYVLEKICKCIVTNQEITSFPTGVYTYVSRRALYAVSVFNEDDYKNVVAQEYHGSMKELYSERFNLVIEEGISDKENIIKKYYEAATNNCRSERERYLKYLDGLGIGVKKLAFIDFVAAGTVQNGLRKIINNDIQGFYFLKRNTDDADREKNIRVESFYPSKGDFELEANIYQFYLFFELILTSSEATFNYIDENMIPVMGEENRTKSQIQTVMEMQDEMIRFADELSLLHPDLSRELIDWKLPDILVGFLGKEYSTIDCKEVLSMVLKDEYIARQFNIFDQ